MVRSLGRACLDGGALSENNDNLSGNVAESSFRLPLLLCLAEGDWHELSIGQLSSYDPKDVATMEHGLDYLSSASLHLAWDVADSILTSRHALPRDPATPPFLVKVDFQNIIFTK